MTRTIEHELLRKAQRGSGDAIAALIRAHQGGLYAYILQLCGHAETAEDVVQEAFVRVIKNLDRFDMRFRFSTWLYTIAKRLYVNANQKMKPAYDTDSLGGHRSFDPAPNQISARSEALTNARAVLDYALDGLGEQQRQIVLLFHEKGWPVPRIARYLDMPAGTIKSHLFRARRRMKDLIQSDAAMCRRVEDLLVEGEPCLETTDAEACTNR